MPILKTRTSKSSKQEDSKSVFIKPKRYVSKVFIHCSASSNPKVDAKEISRWHQQRGWDEIGYHFFIKSDGTLETGRHIEKIPIAQAGFNKGSIAICLNGLLVSDFSQSQLDTLIKLCQTINIAYEKQITFHGHCEVSKKACPVFDYKTVLKLNKLSKLGV